MTVSTHKFSALQEGKVIDVIEKTGVVEFKRGDILTVSSQTLRKKGWGSEKGKIKVEIIKVKPASYLVDRLTIIKTDRE